MADTGREIGMHNDMHKLYALMVVSFAVLLASTTMIHFNNTGPDDSIKAISAGEPLKGAITGYASALSEANILNTTIGVCKINLSAGWNTFSSYCIPPNGTITDTLAYVYQDYNGLYYYNSFSPQNPWQAYIPGMPSWVVQGMDRIYDTQGYLIDMKVNQTLVVNGTEASPRKVNYANGFSLVGFPHASALNTSSAFANNTGVIVSVFTHNNSIANNSNTSAYNISYIGYYIISGTGKLTRIEPGMGLWLNASTGGTWTLG